MNNKKEKWALEATYKQAASDLMDQMSNAPVFVIDAKEDVLDMIAITSVQQADEWKRRVMDSIQKLSNQDTTLMFFSDPALSLEDSIRRIREKYSN